MVNLNGNISDNSNTISVYNKALNSGDAVFEDIRVTSKNIVFWEDHYFRLMASMRIARMEIPMTFTPEYLESEILKTIASQKDNISNYLVKLFVFKDANNTNSDEEVGYIITTSEWESDNFEMNNSQYKVDIYKDYFIAPGLLSGLNSNNRLIYNIAEVYAEDNAYDDCILLNSEKQVVGCISSNIFLVSGNTIKTPPLNNGSLNGIIRKQFVEYLAKSEAYEFEEASISPFELQKADELFITNISIGIQPITNYRKKEFTAKVSTELLEVLNKKMLN